MYDFIIRIHQAKRINTLGDIDSIVISNIPILIKRHKYDDDLVAKNAVKRHKHSVLYPKNKVYKSGGSYRYPIICFKGEYLDISVKNFPRYPVFTQDKYCARNAINGYIDSIFDGFPRYLKHRKVEIIQIVKTN